MITIEQIRQMARSADVAYGEREHVELWAKSENLTAAVLKGLETETEGFIAKGDEILIICFRGTASRKDWDTNLHATLPADGVHAGFQGAVQDVWAQIEAAVKEAGNRKIWVTGHSLGGALAVIAARRIGAPVEGVITFGQPRAGGEGLAKECHALFGDKHLRVINDKDIVPRVPPFTAGFRHSGASMHVDSNAPTKDAVRTSSFVEMAANALQLATDHEIPLAAHFEAALPAVQRRVQHVAEVVAEISGGVDSLLGFAGGIIPKTVREGFTAADVGINKFARTGEAPQPERLSDHKMSEYFKALGLNPAEAH